MTPLFYQLQERAFTFPLPFEHETLDPVDVEIYQRVQLQVSVNIYWKLYFQIEESANEVYL